VVARLHALERPARGEVEQIVAAMLPAGRAGDFTQAMMDLGATICRPKTPACGQCPLRLDCGAFASGDPEAFPAAKAKRIRPQRYGTAWWIEQDGCVWLVRRPSRGLLGGMAALPGSEWLDEPPHSTAAIGKVRHVFTHFALDLAVECRSEPVGEGWWEPIDRLDEAGLPTLYRRAAALALSLPDRLAA
jgi:A/G-specific adenine glycosylase